MSLSPPSRALIGYTGFVGTTLRDQAPDGYWTHQYNSKNINDISNDQAPEVFDLVLCAGISAVKWYANRNPEEDIAKIRSLMDSIRGVKTKRFVLISTIDVYSPPDAQLDELTVLEPGKTHPYGNHRLLFENFVRETWPHQHVIVRLPGLFGPHLRKNVLYDLVHGFMLGNIKQTMKLQWYPMARLFADIETVSAADGGPINTINLFPEGLGVDDIISTYFPQYADQVQPVPETPWDYTFVYDTCSVHAHIFTGDKASKYMLSKNEVMKELGTFFKTARATTKSPADS